MRRLLSSKLISDNKVLKALTLSDFATWSGMSLINIVFTLFVIDKIDGASVTEAGIATMIFLSTAAVFNIPFGKFIDKHKGYTDEMYLLAGSSFLRGVALILTAFCTTIWPLYLLQVVLGFAKAMNYTSWRVLFSKFLSKDGAGLQWGVYETVISVGLGITALIGGVLGDVIDYSYIIIIAGILSLIGTIFPFTVARDVKQKGLEVEKN
jgi:MFS family permease